VVSRDDPEPEAPSRWLAAPRPLPPLTATTLHLCRADLDDPVAPIADLADLLDESEVERAGRFRLERDRRRFVVARGILRLLLADLGGGPPRALRLRVAKSGKPAIDGGPTEGRLRFNLSHSRERALFAFAWEREVGVDLERIRAERVRPALTRRALSPGQAAATEALCEPERTLAFYRLWTLTEAYAKATGEGILGLDRRPLPDSLVAGCRIVRPSDGRSYWAEPLDAGVGYAAALVVEGDRPSCVSRWQWRWP